MCLLGVFILFCIADVSAQGPDTLWTRAYGGADYEQGNSVEQTSDGGYVIAGYTGSYLTDYNIYLIRTDINGDTLWTRTYGGPNWDIGHSIKETTDSGYIIAGSTQSFGAGAMDVWLIKTDANGDTSWTKTYGDWRDDECGFSIDITADGGYIIGGHTESFGAGGRDIYLIRTDENGDIIWTEWYGGISDDVAYSVQETSDRGHIITGHTWSFGAGPCDAFLMKTDSLGDSLWIKIYGGDEDDYGESVQQTSDSGYIVTGWTDSFGGPWNDVWLIKTDAHGDTMWTGTYGAGLGFSVQETSDSGYIVAGGSASGGVYLVKTDGNGDTLWTRNYFDGFPGSDNGLSVKQTLAGGYIVTGYTESFGAGLYDVCLIKTIPVRLLSPNGGEVVVEGTIHTITWWCEHPSAGFRLLFSSDGGNTYPDTIGRNISPDSTSWNWLVPSVSSDVCCVKAQMLDVGTNVIAEDVSDTTFTVRPTGVAESPLQVGKAFFVFRNYPNPFAEATQIRYGLSSDSWVNITIYNLSGQRVRTLRNETQNAGPHMIVWNGTDNSGRKVPSGPYFLRLQAHTGLGTREYTATRKLSVMR